MSRLFRPEAVAHKNQRLHGTVVLANTWSHVALTIFFCAIVIALIVFACYHGFTRKETVDGVVVPDLGVIRLVAPQSGVITSIQAKEGDLLQVGAPVFVLTSERTSAKGATQAAINDALSSRMAHLSRELEQQSIQSGNKSQEINQRLLNLNVSLKRLDTELALQRRKTDILRDLSANLSSLATEGSVPKNAASQKAAELIEQESRVSALEGERLSIQRDIEALTALRSDLPLQSGREASSLKRSMEELKQQASENEAKRQIVVRADASGRLAGIVVDQGQAVSGEQRLASLLPKDSQLEAELYVPTRAAGFVRPGTKVLLRYDAFPYQKFGQFNGQVREVSMTTISLAELKPAASAEPVYRVRVRLDKQDQPQTLKPGMQLSATLVLERRTLMEWIFEPLLGISGRL
ncbi:HlyD family secretion protein [Duganella radicis]|uniref:HlyD family efflux transporter periplasmic adaptor subunit n=1 Tax=Duganella radicis TaxID=551988 RepID=A0A6L6PPI1_9BURK|nr:HlyD family efflux transporter periplasmic adaptor subunit [Duganella radicis]MTV40669.1 HlyD family efflux transporter periplasmic adaptor subunit [Duganella radicis]